MMGGMEGHVPGYEPDKNRGARGARITQHIRDLFAAGVLGQ